MNKREFTDRLILAGTRAHAFAASYLVESLPETLCYTVNNHDDLSGRSAQKVPLSFSEVGSCTQANWSVSHQ